MSWQIGPLQITKHVFEGSAVAVNDSGDVVGREQRIQWALHVEGTRVVIAPEVAEMILEGIDGRWERAWDSVRQRIEECIGGIDQHFEGSQETYEELTKRLRWILDEVLTVHHPKNRHMIQDLMDQRHDLFRKR